MVDLKRTSVEQTNGIGHAALCKHLREQINQHPDRRIPFVHFMEQALYHPQYGYYSNRARQIGVQGDFFTAPHLGADFGQLLARQFVQMWEVLGKPPQFTLMEMGAGQGLLAQDILQSLQQCEPQCFDCIDYIIIEKAEGLIELQQRQLQGVGAQAVSIAWRTLDEIEPGSIVGCCFSNELVDAFAVHQVLFEQGQLHEIYVTTEGEQFVEVVAAPSTAELENYFRTVAPRPVGEQYPDRYRTEVNLAAQQWITAVARCLKQGYLLTIDYGYPADRYYNRVRDQGTLQCYYQHQHHNDPYINVGTQDITTHVNFTALEQWGRDVGLKMLGVTQQAMFLMALGLGDRLAALGQSDSTDPQEIMQRLRQRDALHQLISPMGLGNFGVLVQAKGLTEVMQTSLLQGLETPIGTFY